jgi:hypothetical protein
MFSYAPHWQLLFKKLFKVKKGGDKKGSRFGLWPNQTVRPSFTFVQGRDHCTAGVGRALRCREDLPWIRRQPYQRLECGRVLGVKYLEAVEVEASRGLVLVEGTLAEMDSLVGVVSQALKGRGCLFFSVLVQCGRLHSPPVIKQERMKAPTLLCPWVICYH